MVIHYNAIKDGISPETVITAWDAAESEYLFRWFELTACVWFVPGTVAE